MARQERNSNRRKGSQPKGFKKEAKAPRPKYTPKVHRMSKSPQILYMDVMQ